MKDILTTPINKPDPHPFYKHKTRSRTHPTPQIVPPLTCRYSLS